MSWWSGLLRRLTPPVRLPPVRPEEPVPPPDTARLNQALNQVLADHWQANLDRRVEEIEHQVADLALELSLHELSHAPPPQPSRVADGSELG